MLKKKKLRKRTWKPVHPPKLRFSGKKLAKIQKCKIQMLRNFPHSKKMLPIQTQKEWEMMIQISICPTVKPASFFFLQLQPAFPPPLWAKAAGQTDRPLNVLMGGVGNVSPIFQWHAFFFSFRCVLDKCVCVCFFRCFFLGYPGSIYTGHGGLWVNFRNCF